MLRLSRNSPERLPRRRPSRQHPRRRPEMPLLAGKFAGRLLFFVILLHCSFGRKLAGKACRRPCNAAIDRRPSPPAIDCSSPPVITRKHLFSPVRSSPATVAAARRHRSTVAAALRCLPPAVQRRRLPLLLRPSTVTTCCWELQQAVGAHSPLSSFSDCHPLSTVRCRRPPSNATGSFSSTGRCRGCHLFHRPHCCPPFTADPTPPAAILVLLELRFYEQDFGLIKIGTGTG